MKIKIWKIVGLLSIVIFMLSAAASAQAATLTTTIATHVTPMKVVYDPAVHEIFVSNYDSGDIQVISDSTDKVVATINLPTSVNIGAMAYNPNKGEIYMNDGASVAIISVQDEQRCWNSEY
jgi:DNA-binding beta-propeller fold protein YncE